MNEAQRPDLSIVVPAYNEAARLPRTLEAIDRYIAESGQSVELIVADDGSTDETFEIARTYRSHACRYEVLHLPHRGKAHTVRASVLASSGKIVLFTDADLSTPIEYADRLVQAIHQGAGVAIASREGVGAVRIGEPIYRHLMGRIFNRLVQILAVPGINDTQCGFKAFHRDAAQEIFQRVILHVDSAVVQGPRVTGFDVEVLYLARHLGYRIVEIPVHWEHVPGSKVQPLPDAVRMFADVARVRLNAWLGRYD